MNGVIALALLIYVSFIVYIYLRILTLIIHEVLTVDNLREVLLLHSFRLLDLCRALWKHLRDRPAGLDERILGRDLALSIVLRDRLKLARGVLTIFLWHTRNDARAFIVSG